MPKVTDEQEQPTAPTKDHEPDDTSVSEEERQSMQDFADTEHLLSASFTPGRDSIVAAYKVLTAFPNLIRPAPKGAEVPLAKMYMGAALVVMEQGRDPDARSILEALTTILNQELVRRGEGSRSGE